MGEGWIGMLLQLGAAVLTGGTLTAVLMAYLNREKTSAEAGLLREEGDSKVSDSWAKFARAMEKEREWVVQENVGMRERMRSLELEMGKLMGGMSEMRDRCSRLELENLRLLERCEKLELENQSLREALNRYTRNSQKEERDGGSGVG